MIDNEQKIRDLEAKISSYENDGAAKLFYALNRKMSEMADRLNSTNLTTITLDDPKDKTFDRIKIFWNDASSIAVAVKSLGETAGIAGLDEESETANKKYQITTPESISNVLGNSAGKTN